MSDLHAFGYGAASWCVHMPICAWDWYNNIGWHKYVWVHMFGVCLSWCTNSMCPLYVSTECSRNVCVCVSCMCDKDMCMCGWVPKIPWEMLLSTVWVQSYTERKGRWSRFLAECS